jgi:putative ABC transport system permease protein
MYYMVTITIIVTVALAGLTINVALGVDQSYKKAVYEEINKNSQMIYTLSVPVEKGDSFFLKQEDKAKIEALANVKGVALGTLVGCYDTESSYRFYKQRIESNYNLPQGTVYRIAPEPFNSVNPYHVQYVEANFFSFLNLNIQEGQWPGEKESNWVVVGQDFLQQNKLDLGADLGEVTFQFGIRYSTNQGGKYFEDKIDAGTYFNGNIIGVLTPMEENRQFGPLGTYNRFNVSVFLPYPDDGIVAKGIEQETFFSTFGANSLNSYLYHRADVPEPNSDKIGSDVKPYNYLYLTLIDSAKSQETLSEAQKVLEQSTGKSVLLETVESLGSSNYQIITDSTLPIERLSLIIVIVALFMISALIFIHIKQETKAIGIKKAQGASGDTLTKEYFWRYLRLSLLGAVLSMPLTLLLLPLLSRILEIPLHHSLIRSTGAFFVTVLLAPLCSLWPLSKVHTLSPMVIVARLERRKRHPFDFRRDFMLVAFLAIMLGLTYITLMGAQEIRNLNTDLEGAGKNLLLIETPIKSEEALPFRVFRDLEEEKIQQDGSVAWQRGWGSLAFYYEIYSKSAPAYFVAGDYLTVQKLQIKSGRWISEEHEVVIGIDLAKSIFGDKEPIGHILRIGYGRNEVKVTIVGVSHNPNNLTSYGNSNPDSALYVSENLAQSQDLRGYGQRIDASILISHTDHEYLMAKRSEIQSWLNQQPESQNLTLKAPFDDIQYMLKLQETFLYSSWFLIGLGVAVTSLGLWGYSLIRSREISRRLAIYRSMGASETDTLLSILKETALPLLPTGLIGVLAAMALWRGQNRTLNLSEYIGILLPVLIIAFGMVLLSVFVPAWRYAKREPAALL